MWVTLGNNLFTRRPRPHRAKAAVLIASVSLAAGTARGTSNFWNPHGNGDGTSWSDSKNWDSNTIPGAASGTTNADTATFNISTPDTLVTIDLNRNIKSLTFDTAVASGFTIGSTSAPTLLLSSGGIIQTTTTIANTQTVSAPLVIEGTNGTYTFTSAASDNSKLLDFNGAISGGAAGSTVLTLNGSNTGNNTIAGVISNGSATNFGLTTGGSATWVLTRNNTYTGLLTLGGSGKLVAATTNINGSSTTNGISFNGGTLQAASGGITTAKAVSMTGAGTFDTNGNASILSGNITGSGGALTKAGASSLTLSGAANAFSAGLTINNGSVIAANANSGVLGSGNVTFGGSNTPTLDLNNNSPTVGLLVGTGSNGVVTNNNASLATSTLTLNGAGSQSFAGVIKDGSVAKVAMKMSGGTQSLSGANSYTGGTTISGGTLLANSMDTTNGSLGTGAVIVNGGTLGGGSISSTGQVKAAVTVNSGGKITAGDIGTIGKLATGAQTWNTGGTYVWDVSNATGAAGAGFDQLNFSSLSIAAAGANSFTIKIVGDAIANFDHTKPFSFAIAVGGSNSISGFDATKFVLDTSGFTHNGVVAGDFFAISTSNNNSELDINYVPEPSSLGLAAIGAASLLRRRRRSAR